MIKKENENPVKSLQVLINIFREIVARGWKSAGLRCSYHRVLKKMLVRKVCCYCREYQDCRNRACYDEEQEKNRIRQQHKRVKQRVMENEQVKVRMLAQRVSLKFRESNTKEMTQ